MASRVLSFTSRSVSVLILLILTLGLTSNNQVDAGIAENGIIIVSVSSSGEPDNSGLKGIYGSAISADGRYIAFASKATNLVENDTTTCPGTGSNSSCRDVFVHDTLNKLTERVSVNSNGEQDYEDSYAPAISADGRYVAFTSWAALSDLARGYQAVYVHDRMTKVTEYISIEPNGSVWTGEEPSISADGRYVAFTSPLPFVSGVDPYIRLIFVRDRSNGSTEVIPTVADGSHGNAHSQQGSISADGRYVAFTSAADNLIDQDTNQSVDIFVHDRISETIELVSISTGGIQGNDVSAFPSISADGRLVAFVSDATNLVTDDNNGVTDVFVRDRQTSITQRVSVASDGTEGNGPSQQISFLDRELLLFDFSGAPSISANGRYIVYDSKATNLVSGVGSLGEIGQVYIYDRETEQVNLISRGIDGQVAYGIARYPVLSADGRYVAFASRANNLVNEDIVDWSVYRADTEALALSTITGRIVDAEGNPLSGITVTDSAGLSAVTDANGYYRLMGLAAGSYTIKPVAEGNYFSPLSRTVTLPPDATEQNFIGLSSYSSVSGLVTDDSGQPLADVTISDGANNIAMTDNDGNYILADLAPGTYTITAVKDYYSFSPASRAVTVPPSAANQDFAGSIANYSIAGRVTTESGSSLAGVSISDDAGHTAVTDSNGNYIFAEVTAGTYTLTSTKDGYYFLPVSHIVTVPPDKDNIDFVGTSTETGPDRLPVIFVPGTGGSTLLAADGTELWPAFGHMERHVRLSLNPDKEDKGIFAGDAWRRIVVPVLPDYQVYAPLLTMLVDSGYREYIFNGVGCDVENQRSRHPTLFVFAYDWRRSIADNAQKLTNYVGCVRQFYPNTKVNIIAHSMGGLVARRYIIEHTDDAAVETLITLGTPWLGTPSTLEIMLTGNFLPWGVTAPSTIKNLVIYYAAAHQLLPSQEFIDSAGLAPVQELGWDLNNNGIAWEAYNSTELLKGVFEGLGYPTAVDPVLTNNNFYTQEQLNWNGPGSSIDSHILISKQRGHTTLGQVRAIESKMCDGATGRHCETIHYFDMFMVEGDSTVAATSLQDIRNASNSVHIHEFVSPNRLKNSSYGHLEFTQNPSAHTLIRQILGIDVGTPAIAQAQAEQEKLEDANLRYVKLWRVDELTITHPLSGTVSTTDDSILLNSLPGVIVHGMGERSFWVVLPPTEPYTIAYQSNTVHFLEIVEGDGGNTIEKVVRYNDLLALPVTTKASLVIEPGSLAQLSYDENGDGEGEIVIPPTSSVSGFDAQDRTPPTVTITSTVINNETSLVTIEAIDDISTIGIVRYSFDSQMYFFYTEPFTVTGETPVFAFADDAVGNRSQEVVYHVLVGQTTERIFLPNMQR